ncbi:MAG: pseudouridine synthase [Pseudomonadota bacterium]
MSQGKSSGEGERIAKRLARAGVASRREVERMIAEGRVRLNGRRLDTPAVLVGEADVIEVDGRTVGAPEPARLWRYHKPAGLVTTARDEEGRTTVFDRLPENLPRVMSVGRLDIASEGLLLLTNDGELKRRLELPSTGWLRRYRVRVHGSPTEQTVAPLTRGIEVDGERFQPMQVTLDRQQGANAWLTVGLREGRNREVRRAMEAVGLSVNRLIRLSYGPFQLGDLQPGAVEEVKARVLADQLGLARPARPGGSAKPAKPGKPPSKTTPKPPSKTPPKRTPSATPGSDKPVGQTRAGGAARPARPLRKDGPRR